ncbi:hypothetical protein ACIBXA_17805 [Micromonospora echinaurantiaca]|uniref:hypothetical protein n=1 Tax=Micromonospora echinaurantiaca TaxID=47857 RepID=UPI0037A4E7C5
MRRASVLLAAVGLLCWLTACSAAPDLPEVSGTPTPLPSGSGKPPRPSPSGTGEVPAPSPSGSGEVPVPSPSGSGEVPGPLPFGARTLTGTVERAGDCTMLLVGERRWALTGDVAAALRPGARVTVRGNVAPRPAACGDRDLAQTVAVTRADPA